MPRDSITLLWDVKNACVQIQEFVDDVDYSAYLNNVMLRSAVERQLGIIGEALNSIRKTDPELAAKIPDTHRIIGLRNVLIHGYAIVDDSVVWTAATWHIAELQDTIEDLLHN